MNEITKEKKRNTKEKYNYKNNAMERNAIALDDHSVDTELLRKHK